MSLYGVIGVDAGGECFEAGTFRSVYVPRYVVVSRFLVKSVRDAYKTIALEM